MKKFISLLLALTLSLALISVVGCGKEDKNAIKIGILQVATHSALDDAREGFEDTLKAWAKENGKTITFECQNANGDANNELTMAEKIVASKPNLVLGISTSSSRASANLTEDIPVLFTAVTDPVGEELIRNNVTGTSDINPVGDQIQLIKDIVGDCKKIAFLYNSTENNSVMQFRLAQAKCTELGIELVEKTANGVSDIQIVVESIDNSFDAVYVPTDNLMASNASLFCPILHSKGIPVIAGEAGMCEDEECLATLGINYYKLGVQTAQMAIKILNGESAKNIEFESYKDKNEFFINPTNAQVLGLSQSIIDSLNAKYN